MKNKGLTMAAILFTAVAVAPGASWAAKGHHTGPSKAQIEACKDKTAGTAVEFAGRRGKMIKATCEMVKGELVAVPVKKAARKAAPAPKAPAAETPAAPATEAPAAK